ncbi:MAG: peptide MFS transporter [Gemmatimonadota bacterium]|jgi:POT family proton-dependent oligopeptide transporter
MAQATVPGPAAAGTSGKTFLGHPRGLSTLFFTEMWERFSYYGMRALLVLFMTAPLTAANPGLGFDDGRAGAIYGLYTSMVYLLALPGGWVADNIWGQRRSVFVGGCIIALGHFTLAAPLVGFPDLPSFFLGLFFIVVGTGLLKPNVSTMVGELYPAPEGGDTHQEREERGARRDAAFSIFYMGINLGAILGPFVCGTLGEEVNWHWGFSAAGFGMILGLIQYKYGDRFLGDVGILGAHHDPGDVARKSRNFYLSAGIAAAVVAVMAWVMATGAVAITLQTFATWVGFGILLLVILFFAYLLFSVAVAGAFLVLFLVLVAGLSTVFEPLTVAGQWAIVGTLALFILSALGMKLSKGSDLPVDKDRLMVIFWLFLLAAIFWSGFEQAGSSMNLFAERLTDRTFGGWEMPTTWLQNVNPIFIVLMAPVFGWLWQWLAHRDANPSIPVKFGLGLLGLAAGFFVISWGASYASATERVAVAWLVVTYFLHTCGELALSPVGLSSMTKLAPAGRVGQMMGVWFIAAALGNLFAGLVAGQLETLEPAALFRSVAMFTGAAGVVALVVAPGAKRLMRGVE